ncbi:MAG: glycosyltransferase family 2 protein [Proteobacteria bacterium]|nr:MAG: glycosyltransferase family 2 protein [Pseudomonadota bacterium]
MTKPLVSVIIPVKNGLFYLKEVFEGIFSQKTDFVYEVIVVDSGSTDGSLELTKNYPIKLLKILPHEFNHGATRNFAIEQSTGEFAVLITHDATPANSSWLQNLVEPLIKNTELAGAYGRHIARPHEDPIVEYGLKDHFYRMSLKSPPIWSKDADYEVRKGEYIFFSNNNSCLRRSVWEKIRFRRTEMAEDQQWAEDILEAGFQKAYINDAVVMHSHSYPAREWLRRSFDEYRSYLGLGLVVKRGLRVTIKNALWLWRNDLRILKKLPASNLYRIQWGVRRFFIDWAIAFGQYFGTNFDKMPETFLGFFSMQLRNKRAVR